VPVLLAQDAFKTYEMNSDQVPLSSTITPGFENWSDSARGNARRESGESLDSLGRSTSATEHGQSGGVWD
jgi:hypothetical protein